MSPKKWNKERVIEAIRDRHRRGLSLTTVWKEDVALYAAAGYYHGTWRQAVSAAGVPDAHRYRKWSKQRVVEAILARHQQGAALNATWREDRSLYRATVFETSAAGQAGTH